MKARTLIAALVAVALCPAPALAAEATGRGAKAARPQALPASLGDQVELGVARYQRSEFAEAAGLLRAVLDSDPAPPRKVEARAALWLGLSLWALNQRNPGREAFEQALVAELEQPFPVEGSAEARSAYEEVRKAVRARLAPRPADAPIAQEPHGELPPPKLVTVEERPELDGSPELALNDASFFAHRKNVVVLSAGGGGVLLGGLSGILVGVAVSSGNSARAYGPGEAPGASPAAATRRQSDWSTATGARAGSIVLGSAAVVGLAIAAGAWLLME